MKKILNVILAITMMTAAINPCIVKAGLTEVSGVWQAATGASDDYISINDQTVTFNIPNKGDDGKGSSTVKWKAANRCEIDYVLDEAIESGNITVSYEFKTNSSLQAAARASEIRFTDSADNSSTNALSDVDTVSQPYIYQGPSSISKFTESDLTADEWHEVQYVFYIGDGGIETKQVIIDDQDVNGVFSYIKNVNVTSLKAIEFWFFGNSTDEADYELSIRNMNVSSGFEDIQITSDTEDGAVDVTKNNFTLYLSHAVTTDSLAAISVLDETDNPISADKYSKERAFDGKSVSITMKTDETDSNKTYKIQVLKDGIRGQKSEVLPEDYILSFTFGTIEPKPAITVVGDIENNASDVVPSNMRFALTVDRESYDLKVDPLSFNEDMIKLYDQNGAEEASATLKSELDSENNVIFVTVNNYQPGRKYMLRIMGGVVEGIGGERVTDDYEFNFTTSLKNAVTGTWKKTYNKHETEFNSTGGDISIKVKSDGTKGSQTTRDAFTYMFDEPFTGTNVPVKVKYKFIANEALHKTESEIRFYPYEHGDKGGTCICVNFPYSTPRFRWDNIKFNLPENVSKITPDEWHEIEYLFIVDSTNGFSMINAVIDGVATDMNYRKSGTKQMGCVDFWFYSLADYTDYLELDIKDFTVLSGADLIDVQSELQDGATDVEPKNIKLTFSEPIYYDCDIKDVISIVDSDNQVISDEKYSVTINDDKTVAAVTMNTDDRDSQKTYKIFVDKTKFHGKYYSVIPEDIYISFTLPVILPKATLGIASELSQGAQDITPTDLKFNFIPLPNDRIEDVSEYVISAEATTDLDSVIKIKNADGSLAADVISKAKLSEDCKSFTITLSNYERYTNYIIDIAKGSIVGGDGEIMQNDFTFTFATGETEKPPYIGYSTQCKIEWTGNVSREDKNGITTFNYKNSTAKGDSNARTEFCYYLDEPISNSEGPIEVSYSFQINEGLANATGSALYNILSDKNRGGFMFVTGLSSSATITDYSNYIDFYKSGALKVGTEDDGEWNTIKYIFDVDNGVVKNGYAQLNDNTPVNVTPIANSRTNFGVVEFRFASLPNSSGEYEDYVLKIKDMSVKSLGALKGNVTMKDNENISLRFSYNVPYLFESDFKLYELKNGEYTEIKQGYYVEEMDASDMKQVNIHVSDGGLAYNKDYRISVGRKDITADDYVKLKITDIDFKTKEYPNNMKADLEFAESGENITKVNCSITNLQAEVSGAYIIVAGYNENGAMVDKYCEKINLIEGAQTHTINNISLSGSIKNIKVFIFKDDVSFNIYHMPQNFKK